MDIDAQVFEAISSYVAGHNTMTLATGGEDGPAAASLFYVSDERLRLYFLSEAKAQHAINIARDPRVAVTINEDYRDWRLIQGVQIRGAAHPIGRAQVAGVLKRYIQKYPFIRDFISSPGLAGELLTQKIGLSRFHVVEPEWIRWIDNRAGFGCRKEYRLETDARAPLE